MSKKVYKPKEILVKKTEDIKKVEVVKIEQIVQKTEVEIVITPVSARDFCNNKKIVGYIKRFLEKKYDTKLLTEVQWSEILIKENIVI